MNDAYIVAASRIPVGKRLGMYKNVRPDNMLAYVIANVVKNIKNLDAKHIEDIIIGCAMPEGEQGLNIARISGLLAGLPYNVPGITVNRFCSSGLQAIANAHANIVSGASDIIVAGGVESMSCMTQMMGNSVRVNPEFFTNKEREAYVYAMGTTAEIVAEKWKITREMQDEFALKSNQKAVTAIKNNMFKDEIITYPIKHYNPQENSAEVDIKTTIASVDECPRADTSLEKLAALKPVFAAKGSVTAGNSSQMSDGAAALVLVSEKVLNELGCQPLGKLLSYSVVGVAPEIMGIGPAEALPLALKKAGLKLNDLSWIELNEAFASQALAVIKTLGLNEDIVNPLGGAISLGHPLGATGAIKTCSILHNLKRTKGKYGAVTMCIGSGMGAAGIFEAL